MGQRRQAGREEPNKSDFWKTKIEEWKSSHSSQAEFCRSEGLSETGFSYWKVKLASIGKKAASKKVRAATAAGKSKSAPEVPTFIRFPMSEDSDESGPNLAEPASVKSTSTSELAAEVIDASSGRRLRIFNGADQATVKYLLALFG